MLSAPTLKRYTRRLHCYYSAYIHSLSQHPLEITYMQRDHINWCKPINFLQEIVTTYRPEYYPRRTVLACKNYKNRRNNLLQSVFAETIPFITQPVPSSHVGLCFIVFSILVFTLLSVTSHSVALIIAFRYKTCSHPCQARLLLQSVTPSDQIFL